MKSRSKEAAKDKEVLKVVDDRKVGKRKAPAPKSSKKVKKEKPAQDHNGAPKSSKKVKKEKPAQDHNKPKRPPSAFFVFLEDFRKTFKKENPNVKAVSAVGKAGGAKWKSMSDAEKATYEAKAAKRKVDYEKEMVAYTKKLEAAEEEESDKSKSEIHDEDNESEEDGGEEEDEDEDDEDED